MRSWKWGPATLRHQKCREFGIKLSGYTSNLNYGAVQTGQNTLVNDPETLQITCVKRYSGQGLEMGHAIDWLGKTCDRPPWE